jgi:phytoene dehydrogenase-like protein
MSHVTVVGGGLAGLVAAVACAEGGARVTLHEAHRTLGGRARSTAPPYVANEGTHVFYSDGPAWAWLAQRKLVTPAARLSARELAGLRVRRDGALRRGLPAGLVGLLAQRWRTAPVDRDFTTWASGIGGPETARRAANLMGVVTFDADPGRLSAAFVWERLLRVTTPRYPAVRYVLGGWGTVVDRLAARARRLGVEIETGSRVDALPAVGPVIVATELEAARRLLGDATLDGESGRCALLDVGIERREEDAFVVSDLDEAGFAERYSGPDPSLAPPGHELVQAQMPLRAGESKAEGLVRLERVLDLGLPGWRERTTWRREAVAAARTGALDLPGSTWRDRPAIERGDGVYLAGDRVAAPGLLSEVSLASALRAASGALAELGAPAARSRR